MTTAAIDQSLRDLAMQAVLNEIASRPGAQIDVSRIVHARSILPGLCIAVDGDVWRLVIGDAPPAIGQSPNLLPAQEARLLDLVVSARDAVETQKGGLFDHWVLRPGAEHAVMYGFAITRQPNGWLIRQSSLSAF